MIKHSLKLKLYHIFIFLLKINSIAKCKEIMNKIKDKKDKDAEIAPNGKVITKYLNNSIEGELKLKFQCNKKLLIHFLSMDCDINIDKGENKDAYVYKINNYNYEAFYILITKKENPYISITPFIHSLREENHPLIINTIEIYDSKIPELEINGNEPVLLYFNVELEKINLKYNNSNFEDPIILSFFIKEKIKYKIEIIDNKNNIIIKRTINYKENIIIKPDSQIIIYNILVTQDEGIIINSTMIVKIIQDNSTPFYLEKNQLNLGFIPIEVDYYYYYMEVFKEEEGEIMLFNKRQNGILISKIIEKQNNIIPKIEEFPKYNENDILSKDYDWDHLLYLEFNIYEQKLSFNSFDTEICDKGCFLLITYYSTISKTLEINGTEFSILTRAWNEDEFTSQITNIPLNEYIFSSFEETTVNTHYYSLFIPYETDNIYIEMHGINILGYSKEGIGKINTKRISDNTKKLFQKCQNKMIIKLNKFDIGLNSLKDKYISFAFEKYIKDNFSFYYFRILLKEYLLFEILILHSKFYLIWKIQFHLYLKILKC